MKVRDKTVVFIRYRIKNSKGEVLENIIDGSAINYLHGGGYILSSLEAELEGLEAGEGKTIFISKDRGYDLIKKGFYVEVIIDEIHESTTDELKGYSKLQDSDSNCGPDCIC